MFHLFNLEPITNTNTVTTTITITSLFQEPKPKITVIVTCQSHITYISHISLRPWKWWVYCTHPPPLAVHCTLNKPSCHGFYWYLITFLYFLRPGPRFITYLQKYHPPGSIRTIDNHVPLHIIMDNNFVTGHLNFFIKPGATLPHSFVHSTSQLGGHLNRMLPQKFWTGLIGI